MVNTEGLKRGKDVKRPPQGTAKQKHVVTTVCNLFGKANQEPVNQSNIKRLAQSFDVSSVTTRKRIGEMLETAASAEPKEPNKAMLRKGVDLTPTVRGQVWYISPN